MRTRTALEFCQSFKSIIDNIKALKEKTVFTDDSGNFFCDCD